MGVRFPALAVTFIAALALSGCYRGSRPSSIGKVAPEFTIKDADRTVSLAQLRGKVVVLNFWATWCPPCVEEMPSLMQLQKKLQGTDITVLAVSVDDDADAYHKFLKDYGIDLLTVRDPGKRVGTGIDAPVAAEYGTYRFPESYIIDRKGVIRRKFIGPVDWSQPEIVEYLTRLHS
jgi:peroxiredoxin